MHFLEPWLWSLFAKVLLVLCLPTGTLRSRIWLSIQTLHQSFIWRCLISACEVLVVAWAILHVDLLLATPWTGKADHIYDATVVKTLKIMMTTFRFKSSNLCLGWSVLLKNQHCCQGLCSNQNDKMVLEYVLLERPVPLFSSGQVPWMSIPWTSGLDTPTSSYICTCICTTLLRSQVTRPTATSKWFGGSCLQKKTPTAGK